MRLIKSLIIVSLGASLILTGCGGSAMPAATSGATPAQAAAAAAFVTSNLTVTPDNIKPGDMAMVGVTVTNTGTEQGSYTVTLKDHDGTVLGTKDVTLAGGTSQGVNMVVTLNMAGTHMMMIDNLWHNLVVSTSAATTTTPPTGGTPGVPITTPAPSMPQQTLPPAAASGFTVTALDVAPQMPDVGEASVVVFKVTNNGQAGTYHAEVKIDGTTVATQDVALAAGETKTVNIDIKAPSKEGTFTLSVGDQSIKMLVMMM